MKIKKKARCLKKTAISQNHSLPSKPWLFGYSQVTLDMIDECAWVFFGSATRLWAHSSLRGLSRYNGSDGRYKLRVEILSCLVLEQCANKRKISAFCWHVVHATQIMQKWWCLSDEWLLLIYWLQNWDSQRARFQRLCCIWTLIQKTTTCSCENSIHPIHSAQLWHIPFRAGFVFRISKQPKKKEPFWINSISINDSMFSSMNHSRGGLEFDFTRINLAGKMPLHCNPSKLWNFLFPRNGNHRQPKLYGGCYHLPSDTNQRQTWYEIGQLGVHEKNKFGFINP